MVDDLIPRARLAVVLADSRTAGQRSAPERGWLGRASLGRSALVAAAAALGLSASVGATALAQAARPAKTAVKHDSKAAAGSTAALPNVRPSASRFVLTAGGDTIAIEKVQRDSNDVSAAFETPGRGRYMLDARLDRQNLVSRLELSAYPAVVNTATAHAIIAIVDDSVFAQIGPSLQRAVTQKGALPWINPSFALLEVMVQRALRIGKDSVSIPLFFVEGGATAVATVSRRGRDSTIVEVKGVQLRLHTSPDGTVLGGVIPSENATITRTTIPFVSTGLALAPPNYAAPTNAPYSSEDVKVQSSAGFALAGTLTIPKQHAARAPAVVMITGSGLEDRDETIPGVNGYQPFRQIADTLSRAGMIVLRIDDRGYGESGGGGRAPSTSAELANDTRAAIAYLRSRPDVDPSHVFLIGHSEGGEIAPMIAVTDPSIAGIVTLGAPALNGRQLTESQLAYALAQDTTISAARRDSIQHSQQALFDTAAVSQPWVSYYLSYDPLATAKQLRVPALVLQGGNDHQVSADQAATLSDAMKSGGDKDVTVHVFPAVDHLFLVDQTGNPSGYASLPSKAIGSDVLGTIADWITVHSK